MKRLYAIALISVGAWVIASAEKSVGGQAISLFVLGLAPMFAGLKVLSNDWRAEFDGAIGSSDPQRLREPSSRTRFNLTYKRAPVNWPIIFVFMMVVAMIV